MLNSAILTYLQTSKLNVHTKLKLSTVCSYETQASDECSNDHDRWSLATANNYV